MGKLLGLKPDVEQFLSKNRRRKIWDIPGNFQCSIIGTCITLAELRSLAKKLNVKVPDGLPVDYEIHGYFAHATHKNGLPGKLVNKLLERKHASAIKRTPLSMTPDDLLDYWKKSCDSGDIPGAYWAILTHPAADDAVKGRVFADVHMLSHLVGSTNRADIRRLTYLESEVLELRGKLACQLDRHVDQMAKKDALIKDLQEDLSAAKGSQCAIAARLQREIDEPSKDSQISEQNPERLYQKTIERLEKQVREQAERIKQQEEELDLLDQLSNTEANQPSDITSLNLRGLHILYVGGRNNGHPRLRAVVEDAGGSIFFHDGGIEQSIGELTSRIVAADLVAFPTNHISHSAVSVIKQTCTSQNKIYLPLRSFGTASLLRGLNDQGYATPTLQAAE